MCIKNDLKKAPLGWPLAIASVGTVATIFAGKKLHIAFGAAWVFSPSGMPGSTAAK